ncbi:MAG: hypothetical protein GXO19_00685 [Epsilonproteobacteria bacterium]|nr:hypothetical protein [Campylobacterota bacterium]NPA56229.1 hypothetical protein [Campylobacterota bacterium]
MEKGIIGVAVLLSLLPAGELKTDGRGEIALGYISTQGEGGGERAFGGRFSLHLEMEGEQGVGGGITFSRLDPLGGESSHGEFYGERGEGFTLVEEVYLQYNGPLQLLVGRFSLETPHADSDPIRLLPNRFEGVLLQYRGETTWTGGHITKMAGWESGGRIEEFKPLWKVVGGEGGGGAMDLLGIRYRNSSLWLYRIGERAAILYGEGSLEVGRVILSFQLDIAEEVGERRIGEIGSRVVGFALEYPFSDGTLYGAFNREFGDTGPIFSFGGGPFFTSMEDRSFEGIGTRGAQASKMGVEFCLGELHLSLEYGSFRGEGVESSEADLSLVGRLWKDLSLEALYGRVDDRVGEGDLHILRVGLKYTF